MANTTNFNWATPDDTDLVKDGAAAIRTLGSSIDTSFVDLKGGTTGQVLSKATNTDLDYTWITPNVGDITEVQAGVGISVASGTGPIPIITNSSTDLITTAGDILYGTAADTVARLGIGTAGQVLKVNSGATAPEWGAAGGGSNVKIHYAEPVNNFTSSSGSLVDITDLTITFTPTSATNNILIFADITADYNGQGNFRLLLDGTTKAIRYFHTSSNVSTSEQLIFRTENLSASSHTYKLQTNPNSSTITVYGSSSGIVSNLTIVEIY